MYSDEYGSDEEQQLEDEDEEVDDDDDDDVETPLKMRYALFFHITGYFVHPSPRVIHAHATPTMSLLFTLYCRLPVVVTTAYTPKSSYVKPQESEEVEREFIDEDGAGEDEDITPGTDFTSLIASSTLFPHPSLQHF